MATIHESGHTIMIMLAAKQLGSEHGIESINTHPINGGVVGIPVNPQINLQNISMFYDNFLKKEPKKIGFVDDWVIMTRIQPSMGGMCAEHVFIENLRGKKFTKHESRKLFDGIVGITVGDKICDMTESVNWMESIKKKSPQNEYTLFDVYMETVDDIRENWALVMKLYGFLNERKTTNRKELNVFLNQLFNEIPTE